MAALYALPPSANASGSGQQSVANAQRPRQYKFKLRGDSGFYAEVATAVGVGGRTLLLTGDKAAPRARGLARVAARDRTAFVVGRIRNLPRPLTTPGDTTYVLWAIAPDGQIHYLGSLPTAEFDNAYFYVRAGGINADEFTLAVTSERQRPVGSPSKRQALSTDRR